MPIERLTVRSAVLAAGLLTSFPALAASEPYGVWLNDTGRGAIEIKDCGGKLCGHVVWVKDTADTKGCGRQLIGDATDAGGGVWGGDDAWVYSPEKKKKFNVEITPQSDGTLKVMGYAGVKFLSKTMVWTKAPADLTRCNASAQEEAEAPAPKADEPEEKKQAAVPAPQAEPQSESKPEAKPEPKSDSASKDAPAATEEKDVAKNDDAASEEEGGDVDLSELSEQFKDVFSKKDGKCKLDLPWVKMDFACGEEK